MTRSAIARFNTDRPRCMEKVFLKPGDTVQHATLGEGTVTVADEEFCTVKFETREAMFRLPDAFEEGFLSSEDAEIIEDDEDIEDEEEEVEEEVEEDEDPNRTVQAQAISSKQMEESPVKKIDTSTRVIIAVGLGIFFIPIGLFLFSIGIKSFDDLLGELFTVFGIVFMLGPLIVFIPGLDKVSTHYTGSGLGSSDMDSSIDSACHKSSWLSNDDVRKQIYAEQDEDLSILEDMIQMHSANPDADLEEHYGWDHKIDYDQDGGDDAW